jgi:hypothetical protein
VLGKDAKGIVKVILCSESIVAVKDKFRELRDEGVPGLVELGFGRVETQLIAKHREIKPQTAAQVQTKRGGFKQQPVYEAKT